MAWIEQVQKELIITMTINAGGNKTASTEFRPNWLNASRAVEYNISEFNFRNVSGTLVKREQPMGARYNIEMYIQGADYLERSDNFRKYSESKYPWVISHPMYGRLTVQPISLAFDNSSLNVTKVTGQVVETIDKRANTIISPIDTIQAQKLDTSLTSANSYVAQVPIPNALDISNMKAKVGIAYRLQAAFATTTEIAAEVTNAYNEANSAIDGAARDAFKAIRSVQNVLNQPQYFINSIFGRMKFLVRTGQALYSSVLSIHTPRLKKLFEANMSELLATMCATSVTNITPADYTSRGEVFQVVQLITDTYNTYVENLDTLQSDNGGDTDSYIPDFSSLSQLSDLIRFTVSNLFDIAENAKQQRTITTETDTNLILLAYELYGLLSDDSTITKLQNDNNISFNELLQIKKGREIIYYV